MTWVKALGLRSRVDRLASLTGRLAKLPWRLCYERYHGLVFVPPCYYVRAALGPGSTVVDCGLGHHADFAQAVIERFGACVIGIDPTLKHRESLEAFEQRMGGRFTLMTKALTGDGKAVPFFESHDNESGSVLPDHVNVLRDRVRSYRVDAVTLGQVLEVAHRIDLLKMDIEGEEFRVLDSNGDDLIMRIPQLVIEFHHSKVQRWRVTDTARVVTRLRGLGYRAHTRDSVNYLFFRTGPLKSVQTPRRRP